MRKTEGEEGKGIRRKERERRKKGKRGKESHLGKFWKMLSTISA